MSRGVDFFAMFQGYVEHARQKLPGALVALNPGGTPAESFMDFTDVMVMREGYAEETLVGADLQPAYLAYEAPEWAKHYARARFWHLVHDAPGGLLAKAEMKKYVDHARAQRAGWIYVTDQKFADNPWDALMSLWDDLAKVVGR